MTATVVAACGAELAPGDYDVTLLVERADCALERSRAEAVWYVDLDADPEIVDVTPTVFEFATTMTNGPTQCVVHANRRCEVVATDVDAFSGTFVIDIERCVGSCRLEGALEGKLR